MSLVSEYHRHPPGAIKLDSFSKKRRKVFINKHGKDNIVSEVDREGGTYAIRDTASGASLTLPLAD